MGGVPEKPPISIRKAEALAEGERLDVLGTDLVMALGPVRHVPPAPGSGVGLSGGYSRRIRGKGSASRGPAEVPARPALPQARLSGEERKWLTPAGLARRLPSAERNTDSHRPPFPRQSPRLAEAARGMCMAGSKNAQKCSVVGKWNKPVNSSGSFTKTQVLLLTAKRLRGLGGVSGAILGIGAGWCTRGGEKPGVGTPRRHSQVS